MAKPTKAPAKSAAQRKFTDVQMAVTEVLALVGCLSSAVLAASNAAYRETEAALAGQRIEHGHAETDFEAACDGISRMLEKISHDLCDLEPEVGHG
jgi:hypothetical protein